MDKIYSQDAGQKEIFRVKKKEAHSTLSVIFFR